MYICILCMKRILLNHNFVVFSAARCYLFFYLTIALYLRNLHKIKHAQKCFPDIPNNLNRMSEVSHPSECHLGIMFSRDNTHEGAEAQNRETADCPQILQKGLRVRSQPSRGLQNERHESTRVFHCVGSEEMAELELLLTRPMFQSE